MKYYGLNKSNLNIDINNYYEYLSPNYVFIKKDSTDELIKNNKDIVYKEEAIIKKGNSMSFSPISGKIHGIKTFNDHLNNSSEYLIIENDYQEKYLKRKSINKNYKDFTVSDIIKKIDEYPQVNLKHIKNFLEHVTELDDVVLCAFDDNLYNYSNLYFLQKDPQKVLSNFDVIINMLQVKKGHILVKSKDINAILNLIDFVGTYPQIEINYLPDIYPLSNRDILKNFTKDYLKEGSLVLDINDLFNLYNLVYKNKCKTEQLLTITDLINNRVDFCLTKDSVICRNILKELPDNALVYVNNPLNTNVIDPLTTIIGDDVKAIIIDKKCELIKEKCISCGKCIEVCPLKLPDLTSNPLCIKCNLCSYMCPTRHNLLNGDQNE